MKRISTILLPGLALLSTAAIPTSARASCSDDDECTGGPARVIVILDASSTMLNRGSMAGGMGGTDWDDVREVIAATGDSLYDAEVEPSGPVLSQVAHVGLVVFGNADEGEVVITYAPCSEPNVRWALDPDTSCEAPGCDDPWGGPEIEWSFLDGSEVDPPNFAIPTRSHMPRCEGAGPECAGSDRFVHRGVALATQTQTSYAGLSPFPVDDSTVYINILVTDGRYDGFSTPTEVQTALEDAFDAGITTYVIGFGEGLGEPGMQFQGELEDMAGWGSGGTRAALVANNNGELANAFRSIVSGAELPCCRTIDCSDFGGADDGGGGDAGDTDGWGSADGSGSGSAEAGADDLGGDAEDGFDDDGGCACAVGPEHRGLLGLFVLLPLLRARRRGRPA